MRIFVSSSFEDLREHRTAAIRVLRQLGHEVIAMEDMVAGPAAPLTKVLEMVDRSEAYVGLFAWRYGYVPGSKATPSSAPGAAKIPEVHGASYGKTSITHYEYLRAKEKDLPILAFLLDETFPLAPTLIDGFDIRRPRTAVNTSRIRELREELQTAKVVSWFSTPSDLEARVAAAVTMVGLSRQIDVQQAVSVGSGAGDQSVLSSARDSIADAMGKASARQRVLKIDLGDTWWSTRLYLIAALAERLTQVRRILVIRRIAAFPHSASGLPPVEFVGQVSTTAVLSTIGAMTPALASFQDWVRQQPDFLHEDVVETSRRYLTYGWAPAFNTQPDPHEAERNVKVDVSTDRLRRWFGDSMLQQPVELTDLKRASVVDLMRLLDYPNDFVPVLSARVPDLDEPTGRVEVIDKVALTARLARSYLDELRERARIQ
jgi:hypothetical protein